MKKNDFILAGGVILIAAAFIIFHVISGRSGGTVVVSVNGKVYGCYSLLEDQTIDINDTNCIIIDNKTVRMKWADCPDQICVNHRSISRTSESIICLPNKVTVTIKNSEPADLDGIVQ